MNLDRKQMMDERKSLMREFRQVRQAMHVKKDKPEKGKREKNDVDPREVLDEIALRTSPQFVEPSTIIRVMTIMVDTLEERAEEVSR
jgi:hypothetical protein